MVGRRAMNSPPVRIFRISSAMIVISRVRPRREERQFLKMRVFMSVEILG